MPDHEEHGRIVSSKTIVCCVRPIETVIVTQYEDGCIRRRCNWGKDYCPEVQELPGDHPSINCPAYPTWQD